MKLRHAVTQTSRVVLTGLIGLGQCYDITPTTTEHHDELALWLLTSAEAAIGIVELEAYLRR